MDVRPGLPKATKPPTLTQKVAFLSTMPGVTQVIETHMAFVFLTKTHAFKLKKPLHFGYFDHRSLAARARACRAELCLNRALAGNVYLGVVALGWREGEFRFPDPLVSQAVDKGPVDWLVMMRRLPQERMLDALIAAGEGPDPQEMQPVIAHLAGFYRTQAQRAPRPGLYLDHLQREQRINTWHLTRLAHHLADPALVEVTHALTQRLDRAGEGIARREASGLVIEGHGDLRPEHVCLTTPVVIFDRVESAVEMRVIDVFDEVGYLAAECGLLGRDDLGQALMQGLQNHEFTPPPRDLQSPYTMFRLVTRARLALMHLREPAPRTPEKWPLRAAACLGRAQMLSARSGW